MMCLCEPSLVPLKNAWQYPGECLETMIQQHKKMVNKSEPRAWTIPTHQAVVLVEVSDEESQFKFKLQIKLQVTDCVGHISCELMAERVSKNVHTF